MILLLLRRFPHSATDHSSSVVNVTVKTTSAEHCSYLNLVKTKVSEADVGTILHRGGSALDSSTVEKRKILTGSDTTNFS